MVLEVLETFTSSGIKQSTTLTIYQDCSFVGRHPLCVYNLESNVFCFGWSVSLGHSFQRIFVCSQCSYRHQAVAPWCDGTNLVLHGDCPGSVRVSSFHCVTHWHREQACVGTTRGTDSCLYSSIDRSIEEDSMVLFWNRCESGSTGVPRVPRSSVSPGPIRSRDRRTEDRPIQLRVSNPFGMCRKWYIDRTGALGFDMVLYATHLLVRSDPPSIHNRPVSSSGCIWFVRRFADGVARSPSIVLTILPLGSVGSDRIPYPIRSTLPSTSNRSLLPSWARVSISWDGNGCAVANLESTSSGGGDVESTSSPVPVHRHSSRSSTTCADIASCPTKSTCEMTTTMQASKASFVGRVANRTNLSGKVRKATLPGAQPTRNARKWTQTKLHENHKWMVEKLQTKMWGMFEHAWRRAL